MKKMKKMKKMRQILLIENQDEIWKEFLILKQLKQDFELMTISQIVQSEDLDSQQTQMLS